MADPFIQVIEEKVAVLGVSAVAFFRERDQSLVVSMVPKGCNRFCLANNTG